MVVVCNSNGLRVQLYLNFKLFLVIFVTMVQFIVFSSFEIDDFTL